MIEKQILVPDRVRLDLHQNPAILRRRAQAGENEIKRLA